MAPSIDDVLDFIDSVTTPSVMSSEEAEEFLGRLIDDLRLRIETLQYEREDEE